MMFLPNSSGSAAQTPLSSNNFAYLNNANQQNVKPQHSSNPWLITSQEQQQNEGQFVVLRPVNGLLGGEQARPFFLKSGLPPIVLAQIWQLADVNKDGKLDRFEFSIAMKLVLNCLAGISLPSVLPDSMLRVSGGVPVSSTAHSLSNGGGPSTALPSSLSQPRPMSTYGSMPAMASSYQRSYGSFSAAQTPVSTSSSPFLMGIKELGDWGLPQPLKLRFSQQFNQLDKSRIGLLTGQQSRGVLGESQLPTNVLAQIWNMSDVNKDGCLSIEEFCVAMFLIEMVKAGYALPPKLPNELHSFCNRSKTVSPSTMATEDDPSAPPPQKPGHGQFRTFEDKRKDNLDKGQAELERRRRILREEEERRRADIERREREETERRERERQELERRREAEMEEERLRDMARERERAAEEQRLNGEREEARKRLEQDRIRELEKIRVRDLENQLLAETEKSTQIQQRQHTMAFQLQALEERSQQLNGDITDARDNIMAITQEIERMREQRDIKLVKISELERRNKELAVQSERFSHENLQHQSEVQRQLSRANEISAIRSEIAQLDDQIKQGENEIQTFGTRSQNQEKIVTEKRPIWEESCKNIQPVRKLFGELLGRYNNSRSEAGAFYEVPPSFAKSDVATPFGQGTSNAQTTRTNNASSFDDDFNPNFSSAFSEKADDTDARSDATVQNEQQLRGESAFSNQNLSSAANEAIQQHGQVIGQLKTVKYKAIFEFNARSSDELSIQPGDLILVFEGHQSEPGWLAGQIRDKVGWFPASFAEPLATAVAPLIKGGSLAGSPSSEPLASIQEECEPTAGGVGPVQSSEQKREYAFGTDFASAFTKSVSFTDSATIGKAMEMAQPKESSVSASASVSAALYDLPPIGVENVPKPINEIQISSCTVKTSSVPMYEMPPGNEKTMPKSTASASVESSADDVVLTVGVALYQWKARNDQEMSFGRGDSIEVLEQGEMRWRGRLQNNKQVTGWFPKSYIKVGLLTPSGDYCTVTKDGKERLQHATNFGQTDQTATKNDERPNENGEWFIALYQFDAVETTDLPLKPGNRIWVTDQRDQWWRGTCDGKNGIFPANYVQREGGNSSTAPLVQKDATVDRQMVGRAIATFTATASNQISFAAGDTVKIHQTTPGGWWEGEVEKAGVRQTGWFPGNYVQASHPSGEVVFAVAAFDYTAQHDDELTFKLGDIVEVVDRSDSLWWKGRKKGQPEQRPLLFPANFVQINK
uniref:Intersectin-1 n=1 Tax=Globodera pallida TaxID=36090 RepID=A0A183CDS0_GLOPA